MSRDVRCLVGTIYLTRRFNVYVVAVVSPDVKQCRQRAPVSVVDTVKLGQRGQSDVVSGYLSNYVTELTGCGNIDSPWRVRALPGQRINLTLLDFGVGSLSVASSSSAVAAPSGRSSANAAPTICQVNSQLLRLIRP